MTALEALAILESAVLECKKKNVNTPEVKEALDSLERYIYPKWLIPQFRHEASNGYGNSDVDREGQQQVLRATFLESVTVFVNLSGCEWMHWRKNSMRQKIWPRTMRFIDWRGN